MTDLEYLNKYLDKSKLEEGIKRLKKGEPVQYIVGNVNFYGYLFKVNKNVLIPRFETEELVEKTLNYINKYLNDKIDIIDLGTGSGCIAITLKKKLKNSNIDAIDISKKALDIAFYNSKLNNVHINFFKSNMLDKVNKKYDVIISNPPYIKYNEKIMKIVKKNEPKKALYAGKCGLEYYIKILKKCKKNLKEKSIIAFEIGSSEAEQIKKIALKYLPNSKIKIEKDIENNDRFIFVFNNINI